MIQIIHYYINLFPEYVPAAQAALAILIIALPIYLGLQYFLIRRHLKFPLKLHIPFFGFFTLSAGLAFLFASPLSRYLHVAIINAYLFVTCLLAAYLIVAMLDIFFVGYYLSTVHRVYISPPARKIINLSVFTVAFLIILRFILHFNPLALVAIPTILTAGIALALQDTLKTFIAGLSLGQLIRVGEWISFQDKIGRVIDVNWARTVLETSSGDHFYIPNSLLQNQPFLNLSSINPFHRLELKVGVSYDASPAQVKQVMLSCVQMVPGVAVDPPPFVQLTSFEDFAIVYALQYWVTNYAQNIIIQDEVATRLWYAFRQENIEIPYPIQTLQFRRKSQAVGLNPIEALKLWDLAPAFSEADLDELAREAHRRQFMPRDIIFHQREEGQSLFLILNGQIEIMDEVGQQSLAILTRGQCFGEMSLLTGEPRSAMARSKTVSEVIEIPKKNLQGMMDRYPVLSEQLAELISRRQQRKSSDLLIPSRHEDRSSVSAVTQLAQKIRRYFEK